MPVHIRDMKSLPDPIKHEFEKGHWVLSKTNNLFSSIPFDKAHEQENAYSASSLKSGFFSFLVKVANSAIISQVCVMES